MRKRDLQAGDGMAEEFPFLIIGFFREVNRTHSGILHSVKVGISVDSLPPLGSILFCFWKTVKPWFSNAGGISFPGASKAARHSTVGHVLKMIEERLG